MKKWIGLILLCLLNMAIYGKSNIKINEITYYGTFESKNYIKEYGIINGYYQNQGDEKRVKLPVKISDWPATDIFDNAPEIIIAKAEIENYGNEVIESLKLKVKMRYKISKLYYDSDGYIDEKKCMTNQKWDNYVMEKEIEIKEINGKSKKIIEIGKINIYNDESKYEKQNLKPWKCEAEVIIDNKESIKLSKEIKIGIVW